jgi:hypothetical protein
MNTITFQHQDGDMTFQVRWAWFLVSPTNHLTLSIECKEKSKYDWMANPSFCLVDFPLEGPLAADNFVHFPGNGQENAPGPRAYVYVGTHVDPRDVEFRFSRVTKDSCDVEFSWAQPDTDYYDDRAKENRVVGQCTLKRGEMKNMWIPY